MENFVTSNQNQFPVQIGHGSLLPSEILNRAWLIARGHIFKDAAIWVPIRIHRGYFGGPEDYSQSDPDRLFSRWIGKSNGSILFDANTQGEPEVSIREELGGDGSSRTIFTGEDITCLKRCDSVVAVSKSGAVSTALYGAFAILSDMVPVWGELVTLLGFAATAAQRRVRCLMEFKPDPEAEDQQPFLIADLPEVAFILLDACLHQPLWKVETPDAATPSERTEEETEASEASVRTENPATQPA